MLKKILTVAGIICGGVIVLAIVLAIGFKIMAVDFVDNYEQGYIFHKCSSDSAAMPFCHPTTEPEIEPLDREGYIVTWPWTQSVHTIDLRPQQVCIEANGRVLNCKLVKFNPEGLQLFVDWHGRDDYEGSELEKILKAYAFEDAGYDYPFLIVMREVKTEGRAIDGEVSRSQSEDVSTPVDEQASIELEDLPENHEWLEADELVEPSSEVQTGTHKSGGRYQ